jgi:hypothetical protein
MFLGERAALLEAVDNLVGPRQISQVVAVLWVCLQRANPAVDATAADAVAGAEAERGQQCLGVGGAEPGQLRQSFLPIHAANGRRRRVDELDGLVPEDAAQSQAYHGFPHGEGLELPVGQ